MAGQIPPQFIDELLSRVDIVDIIDARVPLKKAGKNLHACCPFHNEKTPSFTVSPDKQFYHCFGCGAHGTAIGFLMEYDQLSFPESIQELADTVGMQVPVTQQAALTPARQNLYDLMDKVSHYYVHQLQNHPQRQAFQDYIQQRGLSPETVAAFDIGMAPDGWDNVLRTFGNNQQSQDQLFEAGMLIKNDKGRTYDRFRDRLMFPIRDRRGRVIAFGGRVIDAEGTPKYLNSPETPIFHKGQELYGLYQARKANRRLEKILIVEGYMDVIALAQFGINNAVATLGTATTSEHLRLLTRNAPEIVFCFDGDRAGKEAAWRAAENALPILGGNFELKFMFLPEGQDPDTMVREQGAETFHQLVRQAQSYSDFFFATLLSRVDSQSMDGRARLVEIAKPYLRHIPAGLYRDMLEQQLADYAKTNLATLNRHLDKPAPAPSARKVKQNAMANMTPVRMAVMILLQHPQLHEAVPDTANLHQLDMPGLAILIQLLETMRAHPHLKTAQLLERWRDTQQAPYMEKLAIQPLNLSPEQLEHELIGIVSRLNKQARDERLTYLMSKPLSQLSEAERMEVKSFK
ncbi:DNA primase [Methylophaga pinxianii]|uniref:DNA primase n=1 Tax=Methylophaga pinxianii TaxID=2881052 RepID=UPI001CF22C23|nr:DNA primase [Methylophaga pinxianii]MCB2428190.1 DNA primase [Methylophaga pinxianii]UPH45924.1 DNA primase [Methylophaga pinxianii]